MLHQAYLRLLQSHRAVSFGVMTAALIGAVSVGATSVTAQATTVTAPASSVTLNFSNAPIQTVLRTLFNGTGKNFTVDPAVRGTVNVSLADVSFDTALRTLLAAANPPLASDIQDGIYHIAPKPSLLRQMAAATPAQPVAAGKQEASRLYSVPIDSYDAAYIAAMMNPRSSVQVVPPNYVNPGGAGGGGTRVGGNNGRNGRIGNNGRGGNRGGRGGNWGGRGNGGRGRNRRY